MQDRAFKNGSGTWILRFYPYEYWLEVVVHKPYLSNYFLNLGTKSLFLKIISLFVDLAVILFVEDLLEIFIDDVISLSELSTGGSIDSISISTALFCHIHCLVGVIY